MPLDYYLANVILHTDLLADKKESVMSTELMNAQTAVCYQTQSQVQAAYHISYEELNNRDIGRKLSLCAFLGLTTTIMSNCSW